MPQLASINFYLEEHDRHFSLLAYDCVGTVKIGYYDCYYDQLQDESTVRILLDYSQWHKHNHNDSDLVILHTLFYRYRNILRPSVLAICKDELQRC